MRTLHGPWVVVDLIGSAELGSRVLDLRRAGRRVSAAPRESPDEQGEEISLFGRPRLGGERCEQVMLISRERLVVDQREEN